MIKRGTTGKGSRDPNRPPHPPDLRLTRREAEEKKRGGIRSSGTRITKEGSGGVYRGAEPRVGGTVEATGFWKGVGAVVAVRPSLVGEAMAVL
jgi:hypothetical protein